MTKRKRPDNPTNMDDVELLEHVKKDNDDREQALMERTNGRIAPGPGTDHQKMLIYLKMLLIEADLLIPAELEYEALRTEKLDEAEGYADKVEEEYRKAGNLFVPSGTAGPKIVKLPEK